MAFSSLNLFMVRGQKDHKNVSKTPDPPPQAAAMLYKEEEDDDGGGGDHDDHLTYCPIIEHVHG